MLYKPKERTVSPERSHLDATADNPQPVDPRPVAEGFEVSSCVGRNISSRFRTPHGFLGLLQLSVHPQSTYIPCQKVYAWRTATHSFPDLLSK